MPDGWLHPLMKDKVPDGWLYRCARRREKQVLPLRDFVTLQAKLQCSIRHKHRAQGDLLRHVHTNGNQAEIEGTHCRSTSERIQFELNKRRWKIPLSCEKTKQFGLSVKLCSESRKQKITQGYPLEEQRNHTLSEAKFEVLTQETRAEQEHTGISCHPCALAGERSSQHTLPFPGAPLLPSRGRTLKHCFFHVKS